MLIFVYMSIFMIEKITNTRIKKEYLNVFQDKVKLIRIYNAKNLYLKVSKKGGCSFIYRFWDQNTSKETTIILGYFPTMTVDEAVTEAIKMKSQRDSGGFNPNLTKNIQRTKKKTINDLLDVYLKEKVQKFKDSTKPTQVHSVKQISATLGSYQIEMVNSEVIKSKLLDNFEERGCLAQARRLKLIMNWIMQYAEDHEYVKKIL